MFQSSLLDELDEEFSKKKEVKQTPDQQKFEVAGKFRAIVLKATGFMVILAGGAAITLLGGPRAVNDLDFRIICDFAFDDEVGEEFITKLNEALGECEVNFSCKDKTGHTIMGTWSNIEISISRTPTVKYTRVDKQEIGKLKINLLGLPDLVWDKAISMVFRKTKEKKINDLIDLLFLLSRDGRNGEGYIPHMMRVLEKRGVAFGIKIKEEYVGKTPSSKEVFVSEANEALSLASQSKFATNIIEQRNLLPVFKNFAQAINKL